LTIAASKTVDTPGVWIEKPDKRPPEISSRFRLEPFRKAAPHPVGITPTE